MLGLVGLGLAAMAGPSRAAPAGTLDQLTEELDSRLSRALEGHDPKRLDVALSLRAGTGASDRLAQAVAGLVRGRLGARGLRRVQDLPRPKGKTSPAESLEERARRGGYHFLLDLEVLLVEGHLHLQGDLVGTERRLWRDLAQPGRRSLSHLHASVRVDAEVRAYQGSLATSALRFSQHAVPLGPGQVLALGGGDIDGDGRAELVVLRPRSVEVLRHRGPGWSFVPLTRFKLTAPSASLRSRREMGSLVVADLDNDRRAEILCRSSEVERAAELGWSGKGLVSRRELDGFPLDFARGTTGPQLTLVSAQAGQDLFSASSLAAPPGPPPEWTKLVPSLFYSLKGVTLAGAAGPRRYLGLVDGSGQLELLRLDASPIVVTGPRVGTALDLADLDDDGSLEVSVAGPEGPEVDDQISVFRVENAGTGAETLRPLWRGPSLGGQVVDLAHGDFDGEGRLELIAAVVQRDGTVALVVLQ